MGFVCDHRWHDLAPNTHCSGNSTIPCDVLLNSVGRQDDDRSAWHQCWILRNLIRCRIRPNRGGGRRVAMAGIVVAALGTVCCHLHGVLDQFAVGTKTVIIRLIRPSTAVCAAGLARSDCDDCLRYDARYVRTSFDTTTVRRTRSAFPGAFRSGPTKSAAFTRSSISRPTEHTASRSITSRSLY